MPTHALGQSVCKLGKQFHEIRHRGRMFKVMLSQSSRARQHPRILILIQPNKLSGRKWKTSSFPFFPRHAFQFEGIKLPEGGKEATQEFLISSSPSSSSTPGSCIQRSNIRNVLWGTGSIISLRGAFEWEEMKEKGAEEKAQNHRISMAVLLSPLSRTRDQHSDLHDLWDMLC